MGSALTEPWSLGGLAVRNRVLLAPLAGIGNWFVRLQAKRYGAGMATSEMVSSHAIHHRNARTCTELLRIDPRERDGGPVAIQLFGADVEVMRRASARAAEAGADAIDLNMGCPVPKVCRTGAGAALLADPALAVALARAAAEGSGLPVTAKIRSGQRAGERSGIELAQRLVHDGGVAAIGLHPRAAAARHSGSPDYALAAELAQLLPVPVILSGGLRDRRGVLDAFERSGATAVMLARGALGNPWLFDSLLTGAGEPGVEQVRAELDWMSERACEHLGAARATRWMRKAYPWYIARLPLRGALAKECQQRCQQADTLADATRVLDGCVAALLAGETPRYTPALAAA
ncbi:MAG: tRNA dihydrouridine synthase [Solirubrobacteraceae bacterium]